MMNGHRRGCWWWVRTFFLVIIGGFALLLGFSLYGSRQAYDRYGSTIEKICQNPQPAPLMPKDTSSKVEKVLVIGASGLPVYWTLKDVAFNDPVQNAVPMGRRAMNKSEVTHVICLVKELRSVSFNSTSQTWVVVPVGNKIKTGTKCDNWQEVYTVYVVDPKTRQTIKDHEFEGAPPSLECSFNEDVKGPPPEGSAIVDWIFNNSTP